ncbi:EAL domain-containing protein [Sphingomonas sp. HDW15A]|uniref:EAL domain-containing protein n=1 Tax=Sphingomonas sp. HDW15A TaxID=2714942 RepID=UPI00140E7E39|nr:EAL domain-containing protein [Sphingomonas sp. HDW15A]QIK95704.1 EAL domain-containing protein [Sphingomonas sp. HDW15A]
MPNNPLNTPADSSRQHRKMLLWPLLFAILFGVIGAGEAPEDFLRMARNKLHPSAASGDIVLVRVDDKSLREVGDWPWPRSQQAKLFTEIERLGARHIGADLMYLGETRATEDRALAQAIADRGDVTVAVHTRDGQGAGKTRAQTMAPLLAGRVDVASISAEYNWQNVVWRLSRSDTYQGRRIPSLSSVLADRLEMKPGQYRIDYSIDPATVPTISASDVLKGRVSRDRIAGKMVAIGADSFAIGDQFSLPGWGKRGGVYQHVLGAETLRKGNPVDIGWLPSLLVAFAGTFLWLRRERASFLVLAAGALLALPVLLEHFLVFADVTPGLFLLAFVASRAAWRKSRQRGLENALTGLPNLTALGNEPTGQDRPLVAVRVHNYAEIVSTLDSEEERQFVEQVVQRLNVGNKDRTIYQGDEGIFAWFADKNTPFAQHLEALHALFRSPVRAGKIACDVSLSFGVELGSKRAITSRLGSALVAADEADAENLKWKFHDPARQQEAPWRLSLLSQLDEAIDNGEVWLAYQPKVDLQTRKTVGAEALARWTHPEKGPISPTEFVTAAEQSNRIQRLTDFVLEKAISAAAEINKRGHHFEIAVNLSARMLSDRSLPYRVNKYLKTHGLPADRLILELTETAAVTGSGNGIDLLVNMRDLGVKIAIDDYGTGLSTLDYLKKVPASELKIDQSFIKGMRDNRSDLIMVQSTITLAHSLGRTVVAEGVEDPGSLDQLKSMGCDQAQGFIVGRPMSFDEITRRLNTEKRRRAA